jgi:hypothetical protein
MSTVSNAARWSRLKIFSVEVASGSNRLYANGRQQVKVTIELSAEDAYGKPVNLSNTELDTLRLIEYHGGSELSFYSRNAPVLQGWKLPHWDHTPVHNDTYKFFPSHTVFSIQEADAGKRVQPSANQAVSYVDYYVRSVADTTLRIAAKITREDGTVFTSSGNGNGSVTLVPVDVPVYGPEDYTFTPVRVVRTGRVTYDYIPFVLESSQGSIEFRSFYVSGFSAAKHTRTLNSAGTGVFTGYTTPGSATITYASRGDINGPKRLESGYVSPSGCGIVVVQIANTEPNAIPRLRRSVVIQAVDMYGNPHAATLLFKDPIEASSDVLLY